MTEHPNVIDIIKKRQQAWAERRRQTLDADGYCGCDNANIFQGLSDAARRDFALAASGEPGSEGERARIQAAHSSSALACNWFDYWRDRDFGVLSTAFGVPKPFVTLRLQARVPTGMRGADVNLDVLLTTADGSLLGIESTFTEPYTQDAAKSVLKPQYFAHNRCRWTDHGLSGCQAVAERLRTGDHGFTVLDVAQLLTHMLALARTGNRWTLCCLWYEVPGRMADAHRADLQTFAAQVGSDAAHFTALTYQELFARMEPIVGAEHAAYMAYLRDRYIADTQQP